MKAFFWSDLNFADDETCYLDQCENDPCNGRGCKSTWDGKKAGFICERKCKIDLLTRFYINSYIFFYISVICTVFNKCNLQKFYRKSYFNLHGQNRLQISGEVSYLSSYPMSFYT